jgi:hypothetical protein
MPRFHLHIQGEDGITADAEGSDLPDLEAAREEAIEAARQIMSWAVRDGYWPDGQRFVITDTGGTVLLEFPFSDALRAR